VNSRTLGHRHARDAQWESFKETTAIKSVALIAMKGPIAMLSLPPAAKNVTLANTLATWATFSVPTVRLAFTVPDTAIPRVILVQQEVTLLDMAPLYAHSVRREST
jgi:hypothetical protein